MRYTSNQFIFTSNAFRFSLVLKYQYIYAYNEFAVHLKLKRILKIGLCIWVRQVFCSDVDGACMWMKPSVCVRVRKKWMKCGKWSCACAKCGEWIGLKGLCRRLTHERLINCGKLIKSPPYKRRTHCEMDWRTSTNEYCTHHLNASHSTAKIA